MAFITAGIERVNTSVVAHVLGEFVAVYTGVASVVLAALVAARAVSFVVPTANFHPHRVVAAAPQIECMTALAVGAGRQVDAGARRGKCALVTVETILWCRGKLKGHFVAVTLNTVGCCMGAPQWKSRRLVRERGRLPGGGIVAQLAIAAQRLLVIVDVATAALGNGRGKSLYAVAV